MMESVQKHKRTFQILLPLLQTSLALLQPFLQLSAKKRGPGRPGKMPKLMPTSTLNPG